MADDEPNPFEDVGPIGAGGMGEVRRVRDRALHRTLAMKILHPGLGAQAGPRARFVEEAQTTAQLQHPGIPPVHAIGTLPDGRLYFTMREVRGQTFEARIAAVGAASTKLDWGATADGWTFRRLVDVLARVCETMAYAHDRGVVHRDLKPSNVIVGDDGEVVVLDWGIARVAGTRHTAEPIVTTRSGNDDLATQDGDVAGTPGYLSPEQAHGALDLVDARSDVFSLGAMLHQVLTGEAPFHALAPVRKVLAVQQGPPPPLTPGLRRPRDLVATCTKALSFEPADRHPDARAFGDELRAWLDGTNRRAQARAIAAKALDQQDELEKLRARAEALRAEAAFALTRVPSWAPEADKQAAWDQEDAAARLDAEADRLDGQVDEGLEQALRVDPSLPEANHALAERLRARHADAEARRDEAAAARAEARLRAHATSLPEDLPLRARTLEWLQGDAALTLVTDPPGARVRLYRYERDRRRLVPRFWKEVGPTPLRAFELPFGSWLCEILHPDRAPVRYPVWVGRMDHWDGVGPNGGAPRPIVLPRAYELSPEDRYVPAGWFWSGGDPSAPDPMPARRRWAEPFVARRFHVTMADLLVFLDDLVARGREAEALRFAPRERPGVIGETGALLVGRGPGGRFTLPVDADGDAWQPDWPATSIDWWTAVAIAHWTAAREGLPWRLPMELEWEKAARGVDGRLYPWGDGFDPSFTCMRSSQPGGRPTPMSVTAFPVDESPYGIRGMAGGIREFCAELWVPPAQAPEGPVVVKWPPSDDPTTARVDRGGSWFDTAFNLRLAGRRRNPPDMRGNYLGIRLFRSFP